MTSPHASLSSCYQGKRVFLTGHTGFKGAWLATWLLHLGAEVYGYALAPATEPSLFEMLGLAERLHHEVADIRDATSLKSSLLAFQPDFVFHAAAQPLVRYSYKYPVETYDTNVMGTIYVLEALREMQQQLRANKEKRCVSAVVITTDKCYHNAEQKIAYSEEHPLGGHDPYSSSKAMAEMAVAAYRSSYFSSSSEIHLATARAGNVIGGGDWAEDRIIPDCMRSLQQGDPIVVRHPQAIRPWQHVLEPLYGYLLLGAGLVNDHHLATAFNFGPSAEQCHTVADVVEEVLTQWPGSWQSSSHVDVRKEAQHLTLASSKAASLLGWKPLWNFKETIAHTVTWYRAQHECSQDMVAFTEQQIISYQEAAGVTPAPLR